MDIHIFTMVWIQNYDPNLDDLYTYSQRPKLYPTYEVGYITGYNPNNFSKKQTITVDGVEKTVSLDFSGVENTGVIRYGDGGGVFCQKFDDHGNYIPGGFEECQALPWPRCEAAWLYVLNGSQLTASDKPCDPFTTPDFEKIFDNKYPAVLINPINPENAQYWETLNLWNHGSYTGHALIENEDTTGKTAYLITVGHPITTTPCARPQTFAFLDPDTNQIIYRKFLCPCVAYNLPHTNTCNIKGFDQDYPRLWVMDENEQPIPASIKRYKLLWKYVRDNWPIYGIDSTFRIVKGISDIKERQVIYDRSHGNRIPISTSTIREFQTEVVLSGGQGDDGGWSVFTVTPEGETILIDNGSPINGAILPSFNTDPFNLDCDSFNLFQIVNGKLQYNTKCSPSVFHPETVIPNYPDNDVKLPVNLPIISNIANYISSTLNPALEKLNKPKIVFYTFPEYTDETGINLPSITDLSLKYPLKEAPYLSRESNNTFFQNSNLIDFVPQKMLQASELNEFQEKFYKKQSLLISYVRNWLNGYNINKKHEDILGFLPNISSALIPNDKRIQTCNKIIPLSANVIVSDRTNLQNDLYYVKLKSGWYFINTNTNIGDDLIFPKPYTENIFSNFDFINITEDLNIPINLSNMEDSTLYSIVLNVDLSNIITCNQYQELRDNSGGSAQNSPCGANRNLLSLNLDNQYNQFNFNYIQYYFTGGKNANYPNAIYNPINNISSTISVPHIIVTAKKENGQINFYYANGVKIQNI